uniref:Peroxisome assembly protein 12 n=1 Tax=Ascaris suum TaxID=6253 RepID=F1LB52_ASCSU
MSSSRATLRAAHLNSQIHFTSSSCQQPSIFDILSQESLMSSLKPAIGHVVKYLSTIHPQRFSTANKWYDELYAIFDLVLENHYLKRYGASFAENFYSIKRIAYSTGSIPSQGLPRIKSLLVLVLWPYLKDKLDNLYERISFYLHLLPLRRDEPLRLRIARLFHSAYPWLKWMFNAWTFMLQFAYLLSQCSIHSPLLYLAGVRLERLSPEDIAKFDEVPRHLRPSGVINRLWRSFVAMPGIIRRMLGYMLLFVQFVDFFYNSDLGAQHRLMLARSVSSVPAPPHNHLRETSVMLLETDKCPICLRHRHNDTVLSVSGYVFCYGCISDASK